MDSISQWAAEVTRNHDLVYLVVCGSRAYGTASEDSDYDVRGVYVPPLHDCLVGFDHANVIEASKVQDGLHYELVVQPIHTFLKLCWQANPNILDWLFVPKRCRLYPSARFDHILDARGLFLSKTLYPRFRGYATSHLQKMERGTTRDLGEKRKKDIDKFGYSCKNAMHLIRLLRMGCEVLETSEYNVERPDAKELLEIRDGGWSLEEVKEEAGRLLDRLGRAFDNTRLGPPASREDILNMLLRFWGRI